MRPHGRGPDLHRDDPHHAESLGLTREFPNSLLGLLALMHVEEAHLAHRPRFPDPQSLGLLFYWHRSPKAQFFKVLLTLWLVAG